MQPANAEKASITVPSEMARLIREKIASGDYGSNSEVIREALRGWLERDRRLESLNEAISRGLGDAEAGRVHSVDEVRQQLRERNTPKGLRST